MSSAPDDPSKSQRHRSQPLWPWLLMPLAALTIFLGLRSARQASRPVTAPDVAAETVAPAAPGAPGEIAQR